MKKIRILGALVFGLCMPSLSVAQQNTYTLADKTICLEICVERQRISLNQLSDRRNGIDYLVAPSSLLTLLRGAEPIADTCGLVVTRAEQVSKHEVVIEGAFDRAKLGFALTLRLQDPGTVTARLFVENQGPTRHSFGLAFPWITAFRTDGVQRKMYGMIPQELGTVVPLYDTIPLIGMGAAGFAEYLPRAMNNMELCSIYDYDQGNGWFVADVSSNTNRGEVPIQMTLDAHTLTGRYAMTLDPGERHTLPEVAIGIYSQGGWRNAVDYFVEKNRPNWQFPEIPVWLREAGAIYGFSGGGGGGMFLQFPSQELKTRIQNFNELPKLLDEAQSLGTDIVYLWDYWQGDDMGKIPWDYWNKGDYIPSEILGGEQAFIDGIKAIHERGGKVIVYVEPFIALKYSHIGQAIGEQIAIRWSDGNLAEFYEHNYSMNPNSPTWTEHLEKIIDRLIGQYDVDGIFFDSWCWAMNIGCNTLESGTITPAAYSLGVLRQTEHLRQYAQAIKPEAIVMGESTSGPIWQYWDGGLHADFAWLKRTNQGRIIASPIRYGRPEMNYFANGTDRNQMNQTFAAGHHLLLCNAHLADSAYVGNLVEIRKKYADALIDGKLVTQPYSSDETIAAYQYVGNDHEVIIVTNTSDTVRTGQLKIDGIGPETKWKRVDPNGGTWSIPHKNELEYRLEPAQMMILVRQKHRQTNDNRII